jgi:putative membrane protein
LKSGTSSLASGAGTLKSGVDSLLAGVYTLKSGTSELVSNNAALNDGASSLTDGAKQIQEGAEKLKDGSEELGDGLGELKDGTNTLSTSLADGAKEVRDSQASDASIEMFASPLETEETQITTVADNGHAMAAYMMSVALWVGCIAFSIMYPLTQYKGKLKSGIEWWLSKAIIIYPIAIVMSLVMLAGLSAFCGFHPVELGKTIGVACLAGVAFMSILYFFNVLLGKVGSFLMLIFMVVQLAGSAGTYPIEISGAFVADIHDFLPFSYTVDAFRSTISGGQSIATSVGVLLGLTVVFTLLTIVVFQIRAKKIKAGKPTFEHWLEEKGIA